MTDGPPPAGRPPGYDEEDPYEGEDLSTYPDWWRESVELFREHGMRPYRPPRFADEELVPPTVAALETELDVAVRLRSTESGPHPSWALWVDGDRVATVPRRRETDGHTVYELTRDAFVGLVRDAAPGDRNVDEDAAGDRNVDGDGTPDGDGQDE